MCFWCTCTVIDQGIIGCHHCSIGTQSQMTNSALEHADKAGQMFISECTKPGEKPMIDWATKAGVNPEFLKKQ
jgi:hypothetical protein